MIGGYSDSVLSVEMQILCLSNKHRQTSHSEDLLSSKAYTRTQELGSLEAEPFTAEVRYSLSLADDTDTSLGPYSVAIPILLLPPCLR